jgi:hypothetical protein
MSDDAPAASRWRRCLVYLITCKGKTDVAFLAVLIAAPWLFRGNRIADVPDIDDPVDVAAVLRIEVPDERNAYVEYRQAARLFVPHIGSWPNGEWLPNWYKGYQQNTTTDPHRQWLAANRDALRVWRKGTQKDNALRIAPRDLPRDPPRWVHLPRPSFTILPDLALLQAAELQEQGEHAQAWSWLRAAFRCSRHAGRNDRVDQRMTGCYLHQQAVGAMIAWSHHPDVTSKQLHTALRDVRHDFALTQPTSRNVKIEYVWWSSFVEGYDIQALWLDMQMQPRCGGAHLDETTRTLCNAVLYTLGEPERGLRLIKQAYANWLTQIDRPMHRKRYVPDPERTFRRHLFESPAPESSQAGRIKARELLEMLRSSPVYDWFRPQVPELDACVQHERAQQATLEVVLAAQWFFRDHGRFPNSLSELSNGYLEVIPHDPWSRSGGRMHYRCSATGAVVWSVGYDGRNNSGRFSYGSGGMDEGYEIRIPGTSPPKPEEMKSVP